jgi:hypothetical protein
MSIDSTSEVSLFHAFLTQRSAEGLLTGSVDEAVQDFRQQQRELYDLRAKLKIGLEQCDRGEVKRIDASTIKEHLRQRLASEARTE